MNNQEIFSYIDHTALSPVATWKDIENAAKEAQYFKTASLCIAPCFVARVREAFPNLNICTVGGFPLGYSPKEIKLKEARLYIEHGANELDFVINITDAKNGDFDKITQELSELKKICGSRILKIIIETCYLNEQEKISLCDCVTKSGADFIKTSTGFGTAGATIADIKLFSANIGNNVKIKAAGGMRSREDFIAFVKEGASRLGTSGAIKALTNGEKSEKDSY